MSLRRQRIAKLVEHQDKQDRLSLPQLPAGTADVQGTSQASRSPADDRPRVYLAGKIAKQDWRHSIFKDLRSSSPDSPPRDVDGFAYAGPFFISCDHGCYHGRGSHGVGVGDKGCEGGDWEPVFEGSTHTLCRDWLLSSHVVFAYIDGTNPYGTILEIGIAVAMRIPVFLAFGLPSVSYDSNENPVGMDRGDASLFSSPAARIDFLKTTMSDMWLAQCFAAESDVFGSPMQAWRRFLAWHKEETRIPG